MFYEVEMVDEEIQCLLTDLGLKLPPISCNVEQRLGISGLLKLLVKMGAVVIHRYPSWAFGNELQRSTAEIAPGFLRWIHECRIIASRNRSDRDLCSANS